MLCDSEQVKVSPGRGLPAALAHCGNLQQWNGWALAEDKASWVFLGQERELGGGYERREARETELCHVSFSPVSPR